LEGENSERNPFIAVDNFSQAETSLQLC